MNRNQNSHFAKNPTVSISRSRFDRSSSIKLSFNVGDLVPFFVDEVLPGDTFQVDTSKLVRMQTLVTPVMDDIYLDTYYFFVPNRLVWEHWQNFMGENTDSPWLPETQYNIPRVTFSDGTESLSKDLYEGSVLDYMGLPFPEGPNPKDYTVNALPLRGYQLIYNEWFRDQNLINPLNVYKGDDDMTMKDYLSSFAVADENATKILRASKFRDYFTTCLPSPQKGPDVLLPLGSYSPVYAAQTGMTVDDDGLSRPDWSLNSNGKPANIYYRDSSSGDSLTGNAAAYFKNGAVARSTDIAAPDVSVDVYPSNLFADLTNATAATINQLRLAFQMQKIYERDARGGTRYIEILNSHFGVTSPDSRLQRPEYLGGNRMLINVNQVVQNSETTETSPQGTTTAYSLTTDVHSDFTHSFVEHGFVIGICVARYNHTYQQGLERMWSRRDRFDYYFPILANIGEQPVYNREIYVAGSSVNDDGVFGYNEAWADYRYKPNRVAGEMRSSYANSLDMWHLADDYGSKPSLSPDWINENKSNVDRCLAVQSSVSNQLFGDFYIKNICTRPMPTFSIPGLIDHH